MLQLAELLKISIRDAFDFNVFFSFLTIPLIRSDTGIFLIGQGDNLFRKYECLLNIRKEISECSDIFAVFDNTNHDVLNLSDIGAV